MPWFLRARMVENHILNASILDSFEKMARFRNIIVRDYEKIDPEIIIGILRNNLRDFEEFKVSIISYLKNQEGD